MITCNMHSTYLYILTFVLGQAFMPVTGNLTANAKLSLGNVTLRELRDMIKPPLSLSQTILLTPAKVLERAVGVDANTLNQTLRAMYTADDALIAYYFQWSVKDMALKISIPIKELDLKNQFEIFGLLKAYHTWKEVISDQKTLQNLRMKHEPVMNLTDLAKLSFFQVYRTLFGMNKTDMTHKTDSEFTRNVFMNWTMSAVVFNMSITIEKLDNMTFLQIFAMLKRHFAKFIKISETTTYYNGSFPSIAVLGTKTIFQLRTSVNPPIPLKSIAPLTILTIIKRFLGIAPHKVTLALRDQMNVPADILYAMNNISYYKIAYWLGMNIYVLENVSFAHLTSLMNKKMKAKHPRQETCTSSNCPSNSECVGSAKSWKCECRLGLVMDNKQCIKANMFTIRKLKFNDLWIPGMENKQSAIFKETARKYEQILTKDCRRLGCSKTKVINIDKGSIVIDYAMLFSTTVAVSLSNVTNYVDQVQQSAYMISYNISKATVPSVQHSNICSSGLHDCPIFTSCVEYHYAWYICVCKDGYKNEADGSCSKSDNTIVIIVASASGVILILFAVILCRRTYVCIRRRKNISPAEKKNKDETLSACKSPIGV